MKAAVLNAIGDDKLELRDDVTTVDPGPQEIRIRVRATGICAQELFLHEKRILGSFYGSADIRRDCHRMLGLWKAGRLAIEGMISRRVTLSDINDGLQALRGGTLIRQVVVFD